MSHWAELDGNNVVIRVLVGDNNEPDEGQAFVEALGGTWIKTSYNANIRKNYAGIGFTYDAQRDAFIPPRIDCHPENVSFDETTCRWNCTDLSHQIEIE